MKNILFLLCFMIISSYVLNAQDYTKAEDSDPQAKAILDGLRSKYKSYNNVEANFTLELEIPGQPKEIQKGEVYRQGDKYNFNIAGRKFISDGKTIWIILDQNQEVQISDVPEEEADEGILSPQSLFTFYESGDFVYYLFNEVSQSGAIVQQIEFKPLDEYADYSKLRMEINKSKKEIMNVKAFGKDGSRYTFKIGAIKTATNLAASLFTFDKVKYKDYTIVDLR
ncbi:MAG: outer membrane lipoprotein carrier protein LolA [Bacteroidota bacterium]